MEVDVLIVGAGFGGLYALHKALGQGYSAAILEAGSGVGGTWYWNRYPGARCDVESKEYQFGFSDELQKKWTWTERYAAQPELNAYLNYVADMLDLRDHIRLDTRVAAATFDDQALRWTVETEAGERHVCRFCVMATGPLSAARIPDIPGLGDFAGGVYHTGDWPREGVDFSGKRVGVVGTGSSGIQSIPIIAQEARELFVFQRTANYTMPAMNRPLQASEIAAAQATMVEDRKRAFETRGGSLAPYNSRSAHEFTHEECESQLEARWGSGGFAMYGSFGDVLVDPAANEIVSEFVRKKMRAALKSPELADKLVPNDHPILAKRPCLDTDYLNTFNQPHVTLVDIRSSPIESVISTGIRCADQDYPLDVIVFATGFDAMTGALLRIDIKGRSGVSLRDRWHAGPRTYLGLGSAGFPNMFFIVGPGSPSVLTNVVASIEQQVDWITDLLIHIRDRIDATIEVQQDAEDDWVEHVNELAGETLFPQANSWYLGANVPGKPRVFMPYVGGLATYGERLRDVADHGYRGFTLG